MSSIMEARSPSVPSFQPMVQHPGENSLKRVLSDSLGLVSNVQLEAGHCAHSHAGRKQTVSFSGENGGLHEFVSNSRLVEW